MTAHYSDQTGGFSLNADVTIQTGLSGTALLAAVAHEGDHLSVAQSFVTALNAGAGLEANPSTFAAEFRAFQVTHRVYDRAGETFRAPCSGSGCTLGNGVRGAQVDANIKRILASPQWVYRVTAAQPGASLVDFQ